MRDIAYWKKELATMHPTEYIDLLQAIQEERKIKMSFIERHLVDKDLIMHISGRLVTTIKKTGEMQVRILKCLFNEDDASWINL